MLQKTNNLKATNEHKRFIALVTTCEHNRSVGLVTRSIAVTKTNNQRPKSSRWIDRSVGWFAKFVRSNEATRLQTRNCPLSKISQQTLPHSYPERCSDLSLKRHLNNKSWLDENTVTHRLPTTQQFGIPHSKDS
jgi:acyl-ACP thioesterase